MDKFLIQKSEIIHQWKQKVFKKDQIYNLLQKAVNKSEDNLRKDLTNLLLPTSNNQVIKDRSEKEQFIESFINEALELQKKEKAEKLDGFISKQGNQVTNQNAINSTKIKCNTDMKFVLRKEYKPSEVTLQNKILVDKSKKYEVLPRHYKYKLTAEIKICNCMNSKHPIVGNCMNCGKIQCLQEGEDECIICGSPLMTKEKAIIKCKEDSDYKKSYEHKEKLLKYQKEYYSKLQIVDDFSDWFEVVDNSWLDDREREFAKVRLEEIQKNMEDPEWQYSVNLLTGDIDIEYNKIDNNKERENIAKIFMNKAINNDDILLNKSKNNGHQVCNLIDKNMISKFLKDNNYVENSKEPEFDTVCNNAKLDKEVWNLTKKNFTTFSSIVEQSNFPLDNDKGMCLSMHQPWASLLVYGFKRIEGRDWETNYRGKIWIHSASKKPETSLIKSVEDECELLYGKDHPPFPKNYPLSCILGYVEIVDCIKSSDYFNNTPRELQETNSSNYLFICKNPNVLEIPFNMPGDYKIYNLREDVLDRVSKLKVIKQSTFWHPKSKMNLDIKLLPMSYFLREPNTNQSNTKNKKMDNSSSVFTINQNFSILKGFINGVDSKKMKSIMSSLDFYLKQDSWNLTNDMNVDPFSKYVFENIFEYKDNNDLEDLTALSQYICDFILNKKTNLKENNLNYCKKVKFQEFGMFGSQTFIEETEKFSTVIKLCLGNKFIMGINKNYENDVSYYPIEYGDLIVFNVEEKKEKNSLLSAITQVLYDGNKKYKDNLGSVIISFYFSSSEK